MRSGEWLTVRTQKPLLAMVITSAVRYPLPRQDRAASSSRHTGWSAAFSFCCQTQGMPLAFSPARSMPEAGAPAGSATAISPHGIPSPCHCRSVAAICRVSCHGVLPAYSTIVSPVSRGQVGRFFRPKYYIQILYRRS